MHLDDERIQRLIDDELPAAERAAALEHLASCAECRRARASAEAEGERVEALLRELDLPPGTLEQAARTLDAPRPALEFVAPKPRPSVARWMAAAGLVAALAGAAFAIPGSPVARWVRQVLLGEAHQATPTVPSPEKPAGIAVTPGANLVIEFVSQPGAGNATVRLTDSSELTIRTLDRAVTFLSDVDRVTVDHVGASDFEIEVPRAAPAVEFRVAGVPRFRKQGERVTLARESSRDVYVVPLAPP